MTRFADAMMLELDALSGEDVWYVLAARTADVPPGSTLADLAFCASGRAYRQSGPGTAMPGYFSCEHTPNAGWCDGCLRVFEEVNGVPVLPHLCRHDERERQARLGLQVSPPWEPTREELEFEIRDGIRDADGRELPFPIARGVELPDSCYTAPERALEELVW